LGCLWGRGGADILVGAYLKILEAREVMGFWDD
jgi:hypothetical protein